MTYTYKTFFRIAKILQAGLMTRWKQLFWLPENKCTVRSGVEPVLKVNIIDMFGAFFLLALGM